MNKYLQGIGELVVMLAVAACAHDSNRDIQQLPSDLKVTPVLDPASQLVLVTTPNWESIDGQLQLYERSTTASQWLTVGASVPVVVGRNGLGWDSERNVNTEKVNAKVGPIKKEGDGKAPAGIFSLTAAFGYAPLDSIARHKTEYIQATQSLKCVDDSTSIYYNRIVDRNTVSSDWNSAEDMLRSDSAYKWGIVVDYNSHPIVRDRGSCIFLHVWEGQGIGTAGCTAMEEAKVMEIVFWLDPKKHPALIQMPASILNKYGTEWNLPR